MSLIKTKQVQINQELKSDTFCSNGRLLLTAGTILEKKHLEILRTWGVIEVDIISNEPIDEEITHNIDDLPDDIKRQIIGKLNNIFKHNDTEHPLIKELITQQQIRMVSDYQSKVL